MKKVLLIFCAALLICSAGCRRQPATDQPMQTDLTVTTPYFSLTLPSVWEGNYEVRTISDGDDHRFRLVDPISEAEYGGRYFTVALIADPLAAAEICFYNGTYFGVLQADKTYTVVIENPTDLPVPENRAKLYSELQETKQQVLESFAPAAGYTFTLTGTQNYKERAALLQTHTHAGEVADQFAKDTNIPLTYVGLCTDLLVNDTDGVTQPREGYAHYLYQDENGSSYFIPLCFTTETNTVMNEVYCLLEFPRVDLVWAVVHTKWDDAYNAFLDESGKNENPHCLKDLDGEGAPELLVMENTTLSVYHLQDGEVVFADKFDSVTATMTYHYWYGIDFPGLFTVSVGGGQTHYGYLSFASNKLTHTAVSTKDSPDPSAEEEITPLCDDARLCDIATQVLPTVDFTQSK